MGSLNIGFDLACFGSRDNGISTSVYELCTRLAEAFPQHTFHLFHAVPWELPEDLSHLKGKNVRIVDYRPVDLVARFGRKFGWVDDHARFIRFLNRLDLLHWNAYSERRLAYLDDVPGLPKVVTLYDATTELHPECHAQDNIDAWNRHFQKVMDTNSWWITVSKSSRNDLVSLRGLDVSRSRVIYQGCQFEGLAPGEPVRKDPYILSVGVLQPLKNQLTLVRAFQGLKRICPEAADWQLVLAGKPGWKCEELLAEAHKTPSILLRGFVERDELIALYRGASLFVFPSIYEGIGLPVLEAMTLGVPVITSNVSSLPEIAGDAAVLVNPHDVEALQTAMAGLVARPAERDRLRQVSIQNASRFPWANTVQATMGFFEEVIANWSAPGRSKTSLTVR